MRPSQFRDGRTRAGLIRSLRSRFGRCLAFGHRRLAFNLLLDQNRRSGFDGGVGFRRLAGSCVLGSWRVRGRVLGRWHRRGLIGGCGRRRGS